MIPLNVNGVTYQYPDESDEGWGPDATKWALAVTQGTLQKAGGLFTLTSDVDFGAAFGLKSLYYKTRSSNIATTGQFRLSNSDTINFRNSGNTADLTFGTGSSDAIPEWNGIDLVNLSTAQTLTNKTIVGAIFTGGTFTSPTIITPTVSGGTFSSPTITTPTISNPSFSGVSLFPDGSASAPSIAFASDFDTMGLFRVAANTLGFSTSSTQVGSVNALGAWTLGASAGTQTHTLNGNVAIIGTQFNQGGSTSSPAITFSGRSDVGLYSNGAHLLDIASNNVQVIEFSYNGIVTNVTTYNILGSVSTPSYSFIARSDVGLYSPGAHLLDIASNGSQVIEFSYAGISPNVNTYNILGSQSSPSYSFNGRTDVGLYSSGAHLLDVTVSNSQVFEFASNGNVSFVPLYIRNRQSLNLFDTGNVNYVQLIAPSSLASTYTITFPTNPPAANTSLTYDGTNYVWAAEGIPPLNSVTLIDNTSGGTVASFVSASTNVVFIQYSLKRGTNYQAGELKIVNDGAAPRIVDVNNPIGDCGTTFSVSISGSNLLLQYTTTSTGTNVSMKYSANSWQA